MPLTLEQRAKLYDNSTVRSMFSAALGGFIEVAIPAGAASVDSIDAFYKSRIFSKAKNENGYRNFFLPILVQQAVDRGELDNATYDPITSTFDLSAITDAIVSTSVSLTMADWKIYIPLIDANRY